MIKDLEAIKYLNDTCINFLDRTKELYCTVTFTRKRAEILRDNIAEVEKALLKAQEQKKYLDELKLVEKKLKALEILKKLFRNPDGYSMLALVNCEYPDTSFRIESTDDSWIHTEISKEEFDILKEVLE